MENSTAFHLFKNQQSLTPFRQLIDYTVIGFDQAKKESNPQTLLSKAQMVVSKIDQKLRGAQSCAFTVHTGTVNDGCDIEAHWLFKLLSMIVKNR